MRQHIMSILVALALIAPVEAISAASKSQKLAKCSGKQRRPANLNGSILPTVGSLADTSTPAGQMPPQKGDAEGNEVEVFPRPAQPAAKPEPQVPPISSANPATLFRSC